MLTSVSSNVESLSTVSGPCPRSLRRRVLYGISPTLSVASVQSWDPDEWRGSDGFWNEGTGGSWSTGGFGPVDTGLEGTSVTVYVEDVEVNDVGYYLGVRSTSTVTGLVVSRLIQGVSGIRRPSKV